MRIPVEDAKPVCTMSVVVPCHNEAETLPLFVPELSRVVEGLDEHVSCELVLVDDGSQDGTQDVMRAIATGDKGATSAEDAIAHSSRIHTRWLSFSRNFGKEAALYAGLKHATGDFVAIIDADLQDPPALLAQMLETLETRPEVDVVATRRTNRTGEPALRSWFAHRFYHLASRITEVQLVDGARDFRLMRRQVVDAVLELSEYNRFSKGIFSWVGFNTEWIDYENRERVAGSTNWSFWQLVRYAIDGITAFSSQPLAIASVAGFILTLVGFLALLYIVIRAALFGDPVAGWPSLVSIVLFLGGAQLLGIGIIGQYLAKTYLEVKRRPIYLVRDSNYEREDNPRAQR